MNTSTCPICSHLTAPSFYQVDEVPIHSVVLIENQLEAIQYARGEIALAFCKTCGFIFNEKFDPPFQEYADRYEPTQAFSETFNEYHTQLAEQLIERYTLYDKDVIEIGSGQGEFLDLFTRMGGNRGTGFDPAYNPERAKVRPRDGLHFVQDLYSEKYAHLHADVIICKMTLEHIKDPVMLLRSLRQTIGDRPDVLVFFQVPDMQRILMEFGFWDIYYEHCSYFTPIALRYLFTACKFEVLSSTSHYGGQYLTIEASPRSARVGVIELAGDGLHQLEERVSSFGRNVNRGNRELGSFLARGPRKKTACCIMGSRIKSGGFFKHNSIT